MDGSDESAYVAQRRDMVEGQLRSRGIHDSRVLQAMQQIPRHSFVPNELQTEAYGDHPLAIGEEQTISQPFIIALSLQALQLNGAESVLEVGTGSGYQTALLSLLAKQVYSVERHASLAENASAALASLGVQNVKIRVGDGSQGWSEYSPYDSILVSAAAPAIPRSLVEQLSQHARMVIPVGPPHAQELLLLQKTDNEIRTKTLDGCRFVPLIGSEGY
jgi:protein-L-isoaspartate(D-aspartate) O-methyltransferase